MKSLLYSITYLLPILFCSGLEAYQPSEVDKQTFRWSSDTENGAPSTFYDIEEIDRLTGFEYEIANAIAEEIGKEPVFMQTKWDGLVPGLKRDLFDAILAALVITPERQAKINFSKPYYITYAQLIVRDNDTSIESLSDTRGKTVGTLRNTKTAKILEEEGDVHIRYYEHEISLLKDLLYGRVDAVILDRPIALYYATATKGTKILEEPIGHLEYGVGINKENKELLGDVNQAIEAIAADGRLRNILERWNLWNPYMAAYLNDFSSSDIESVEYDRFMSTQQREPSTKDLIQRYISFLPILGKGAWITLQLSTISMLFAMACGLFLAVCRIYGHKSISFLANIYIEVIRGTPLLIQLYFIFYGLPNIGIKLDPFMAGILSLGSNYAAYEAENYRAGILSVPHGQMEAARALGMTHWQSLRHVILPQAFRTVIPPVTNDFISLLKDSALVSVITIVDLAYMYTKLASVYYDYLGIGLLVAGIYFAIGFPFAQLGRWAEKRLSKDKCKRGRY